MALRRPASAQATQPNYELHSLGWKAFQELCVAIASELWGQTVASYSDSHDGGRDGAFHGSWTPQKGESFVGSFTVQCKFFSQPNKNLHPSNLEDELVKAAGLANRGLADNYIVLTNARLSGDAEDKLRVNFESIPGIKRFAVYGAERLSQFIRESPHLRRFVSRFYGLGDLTQILDERAYAQAQEILSSLGGDLGKFVATQAYRQSVKTLDEHGFVMLLGEPTCGKSMIAARLAFSASQKKDCAVLKIDSPEEFTSHFNRDEPNQFFWIDDVFGATQFDPYKAANWNQVFLRFKAALRSAKFVFTSRDYLYKAANNFLKEPALSTFDKAQVVIQVKQLTQNEREQILYNHIKRGTQSKEFKRQIKPFLPALAAHPRFTPEIARRLGSPIFTKKLFISTDSLEQFVEQSMELLQEIIRTLDVNSRSAIAAIFMRGGSRPSPIELTIEETRAVESLGGSATAVQPAAIILKDSLLIQEQQRCEEGINTVWRFKHPTIQEAFSKLIAENCEWIDIYLAGTSIEQLLIQTACDHDTLRLIVPPSRYDVLLARIEEAYLKVAQVEETASFTYTDTEITVDRFYSWLTDHSNKAFLTKFISRHPTFLSSLKIRPILSNWYVHTLLIEKLHRYGLLPESERLRHVARLHEFAVSTPDFNYVHRRMEKLFTPNEFSNLLADIRSKLLPKLETYLPQLLEKYHSKRDRMDHFDGLTSTLSYFVGAFVLALDTKTAEIMSEFLIKITLIRREISRMPNEFDVYEEEDFLDQSNQSRSIFDDVDR